MTWKGAVVRSDLKQANSELVSFTLGVWCVIQFCFLFFSNPDV